MRKLAVGPHDVVCGISASGSAAFVRAALSEARHRGATTALLSCAPREAMAGLAHHLITLEVGAEVVAGSTRMKAGLATKAVLHTLSTAAMIRGGKIYDNLMVDVQPTNKKLRRRATRLVASIADIPSPAAARLLRRANDSVKVAVVMARLGLDRPQAMARLKAAKGRLRDVLSDS